jgi:hypothetical protein
VECLTRYSYSSCGAVSWRGADIENVADVAVAAAAAVGRDSAAIRYGSLKFVFADYVIVDGSEGFDYCVKLASLLVCSDCCCPPAHEPAKVLERRTPRYRSSGRAIGSRPSYCYCDSSPSRELLFSYNVIKHESVYCYVTAATTSSRLRSFLWLYKFIKYFSLFLFVHVLFFFFGDFLLEALYVRSRIL